MDNSPVIFIRYSAKLSDGGSQLSQTSWLSKYFDHSGHVIKTTAASPDIILFLVGFMNINAMDNCYVVTVLF